MVYFGDLLKFKNLWDFVEIFVNKVLYVAGNFKTLLFLKLLSNLGQTL